MALAGDDWPNSSDSSSVGVASYELKRSSVKFGVSDWRGRSVCHRYLCMLAMIQT